MERIINIVNNFLINKKLILEEDLQNMINSNNPIEHKLQEIDRLLGEMVLIDDKIKTWYSLINTSIDVKNEE